MLLAAMEALAVVGGIELAAKGGLQQEVECLAAVVGLPELDDEFRIGHHQDVFLVHHTLLHAGLDDVALAETLHGVGVTGNLVLVQLNRAEATATQKTNALQVLPQDLVAEPLAVIPWHSRLALGHAGAVRVLPRPLNDVLQRTEQQGERVAIQDQGLRGRRSDLHGGRPALLVQERVFAEVLRGAAFRGRRELRDLLAVLEDVDLAIVEDVEGVAGLALLDDKLVLGKVHLHKGLRHLPFFLSQERRENRDAVQVLHVLRDLGIGHLHQDVLEVRTVDDPDNGVLLGLHRGRTRHKVEQSQLAEAAALVHTGDDLRLSLGSEVLATGALLLLGDIDVEAALLNNVEEVGIQVSFGDDLMAGRHVLFPHDFDEALHACVVQGRDRLQVLVSPDGT
mmetsp:Transcript_61498/g.173696  ORF Transcript_61498/g.173696 Transcript_61498/m.173696 type:complete len:395 (+) Transcript_61498:751-1935(+)